MDIAPSLKLYMMLGQIEVEGSAKYLQNKKCTDEWVVYVRYQLLNQVEELELELKKFASLTGSNNIDLLQNAIAEGKATHFVRKIHYGTCATFTVTKTINETEGEHEVKGQLETCGKELVKVLKEHRRKHTKKVKKTGIKCQFECDCSNWRLVSSDDLRRSPRFCRKLEQEIIRICRRFPFYRMASATGITN